jgi:hypothetical protein
MSEGSILVVMIIRITITRDTHTHSHTHTHTHTHTITHTHTLSHTIDTRWVPVLGWFLGFTRTCFVRKFTQKESLRQFSFYTRRDQTGKKSSHATVFLSRTKEALFHKQWTLGENRTIRYYPGYPSSPNHACPH